MRQLIGKFEIASPSGNRKSLKVFTNREEGTVDFSLTSNRGTLFSISNMQCGLRGPHLPDNTYEYPNNKTLMKAVKEAIEGGVYNVIEEKLFIEKTIKFI
jgi:hypothetical protein